MAADVARLNDAQRDALDTILVPHLSLENSSRGDADQLQNRPSASPRTAPKPGKASVTKATTIAADNKKRQGMSRKSSERYASRQEPPSPPDPNSEAKSVCIKRMQARLEVWNDELHQIAKTKKEDDNVIRQELEKRDQQISELSSKYSIEQQRRDRAETERDDYSSNLAATRTQLGETNEKLYHAETQLKQYTQAYQEADTRRSELEEEVVAKTEKLKQSEDMRKRLHEQVTEVQGLLRIQEQRSRFCVLM